MRDSKLRVSFFGPTSGDEIDWSEDVRYQLGREFLFKDSPLCSFNVFNPGCRERLSWRALSSPAELDRAGVLQTHPFHQARQRLALCTWEQPQLFSEQIRAAFRSLRS